MLNFAVKYFDIDFKIADQSVNECGQSASDEVLWQRYLLDL